MGGLDKKLATTVEKVVKRKASELKQKQSEEDRKAAETESRSQGTSSEFDDETEVDADPEVPSEQKQSHKREKDWCSCLHFL